jgi:hypothetical protein
MCADGLGYKCENADSSSKYTINVKNVQLTTVYFNIFKN